MGVLVRGFWRIHMTGGEPAIMEEEWKPGGSMSLWDVMPLLLKAKTQRRLVELEGVQVGSVLEGITSPDDLNDLNERFWSDSNELVLHDVVVDRELYGEVTERWTRGGLKSLLSKSDANDHKRGLKTVTDIELAMRAVTLQRQAHGMPEPESYRRWRDELDEMGAVIRHHRDHSPGPWMQGYVYPESTGVSTGY
jgi:hypothetical protein